MTLAAALSGLRPTRWFARSRPVADGSALVCTSTSRTHVGRVRSVNEDRVLDRPDAGLWAVIDGMGGHAAGDLAAEAVLGALQGLADRGTPTIEAVTTTLEAANHDLYEAGRAAGSIRGATVVVLIRSGNGFQLCWAGDCRAYRQRGAALEQLTRDHSVVQELVEAGQLTAEQASRHPRGNVVTRALGAAARVSIETKSVDAEAGDLLILSSDGLNRAFCGRSQPSFGRRRLSVVADSLVAAAIDEDGSDNVSVILIGLTAPGDPRQTRF